MPKIDRNEYEAAEVSSGGDFQRMGAGGYVCRIQAVRTHGIDYGNVVDYVKDKQYVKLIFDVDEGELAGKFSDDYWASPDKDWGHQFYLSWKNMQSLKRIMVCLEESNPGFDALAAFEADRWELFIGKLIGLVFGEEEYIANDGTVKTRLGFGRAKSVQDIRDGRFRVPELKKVAQPQQEAAAPSGTYDDIPF